MRKIKQIVATVMATVMMMGTMSMVSYAANKKITSLSLVVESEIEAGESIDMSDITVTSKNSKFSVSGVEVTAEGFEWQLDDEPTFEVTLDAEDG